MARALTVYIAGAAFALTAAAAAVAYAQATSDDAVYRVVAQADRDAATAGPEARGPNGAAERHERRIIVRDGDHGFVAGHGRHMDMAEHLRTMLQLKPGQEAALQAFVTAVRPQRPDHDVMYQRSRDDAPKTTTERLAEMENRLAQSQAQARARIEATRRFYAQLEPSQKKVFDEMPMLMIGPMGPIGPMMMGPGPMKIRFEHPPMPPMPPAPPAAPR